MYPSQRLDQICDQLRLRPDVAAVSHDREWDNIFSVIVEVEPKASEVSDEKVFVWIRLSEIFPIACSSWKITNKHSAFAALEPPQTIVENFPGPVSDELRQLETALQHVVQINGYLIVQPDDLNFSVGEPLKEQTAERRQITGASFFFGWDFSR